MKDELLDALRNPELAPGAHLLEVNVSYVPEPDDRDGKPWCCQVLRRAGDEDVIQGWGSDPLAAALECLRQTYAGLYRVQLLVLPEMSDSHE